MQKHLAASIPGCLFSCCFRTFSISLERFLASPPPSARPSSPCPPFFSQQITVESYRRGRAARKPYVLSTFLNGSSGNFRLDVFVCLLRTVNELRSRSSATWDSNDNRITITILRSYIGISLIDFILIPFDLFLTSELRLYNVRGTRE